MGLLPPPRPPLKHIEKLGAKLAEFFVEHPVQKFAKEEVEDAQPLVPYLTPFANNVYYPLMCGTLSELQLYLDCKVVENLTKLLEGLVDVCCIPARRDKVCHKGLIVYALAFAVLTRIAELARALATEPQGGKAVALKFLDQLQPEDHEQAPGTPQG
jgi:hypothetical protein